MEGDGKVDSLLAEKKILSALNNLPPIPDLSKHFSARNAKVVASLCVLGFIIYHSVLLETLGSDSCQWLLSDGRFQGLRWQPFGCMMHPYSRSDASSCMRYVSYWKGRNQMIFMGDEKTKKLFVQLVELIDGDGAEGEQEDPVHPFRARKSMKYSNYTNTPAEVYDDARNEHYEQASTGLYAEYRYYPYLNNDFKDKIKEYIGRPVKHRPTTIVIGFPLSDIDDRRVDIFNLTDDRWPNELKQTGALLTQIISEDTDVMWNLQEPIYDVGNKHPNESRARNHAIDSHNRAALEQFEHSKIRLWKSSRLIAQIFQKNKTLPLNETEHSQLDTQILLNYKCNGNMYYPDGTCCTVTEKPTLLQFFTAFIFVLCISFSIIMFCACRRDVRESKTVTGNERNVVYQPRNIEPSRRVKLYEVLKGFSKLGIIVGYAFLCDRTTFFMKENKSYTHLNFLFPLGYVILIGLFWAKDSEYTEILHRDQTDEWKGWMQLVILIYHFTGASQVLPVYMFIRCLVTAYVFLSAYGNFLYSWNTGDYSFYRYCRVMVRYNLLVVCLCMVMNRPYQFYYFVPLITFWYTVMFLTAALWPRANKTTIDANFNRVWYLIIKLIILATLTTLLYNFEIIFEKIFSANPLKPLFIMKDKTIHEWQFRWTLDRYSSLFGVAFALFVIFGHKYNIIHDKDNESYLFKHDAVNIVTTFLSVGSFIGYAIMVIMCQTQEDPKKFCNNLHSYVAFIPIIGYIMIRNIAGPIRTLYSPFFAWFGKFALELFVAQYHIWLAADTNGILVLVPNYPILNVAVTTFIFVCAAHELHHTTAKLSNYLVPNNWISLARNLFIFCGLMVPVAIYSGAFNL